MRVSTSFRALTPISVTQRRGAGFAISSQAYLPGPMVRGAIAQAYLERGGSARDAAFQKVFVEEGARFLDQRADGSNPWPASMRRCADNPDEHPLADLLVEQWRGRTLLPTCAECGGKTTRPAGFCRAVRTGPKHANPFADVAIRMERRMHTAIDPVTLRVAPAQFHSSRLLAAGEKFEGAIHCPDSLWPELATILQRAGKQPLSVGRGRTRGQGAVEFRWREGAGRGTPVRERLERFLESCGRPGEIAFTVTFHSPAFVLDEWLASKTELEGTDLHAALDGYQRAAAFTSQTEWSGWHAAANLPRADVTVIAAGSCYVFVKQVAEQDRTDEVSRLAGILESLESEGVGERLGEGFGEAEFCSAIHHEYAS